MDGLNQSFQAIAESVLMAVLPVLAVALVRWLMAKYQFERGKIIAAGQGRVLSAVEWIVGVAVRSAEQQFGGKEGRIKRDYVMQVASDWLSGQGIDFDIQALNAAIESAVLQEFSRPHALYLNEYDSGNLEIDQDEQVLRERLHHYVTKADPQP